MATSNHKGKELNNVRETWEQNERSGADAGAATNVSNDLQETIREEAEEYDRANPDDRTLDGERATLRDEQ